MKIFFQGDSITDAGRDRSDNHNLAGYSQFVKNALGEHYEYVNYACSGDTSRQALARHEAEFAHEKPDILVYLIGVNDVWRNVDHVVESMTTSEEFIDNVTKVITISKTINPNVKIIFLEPYLMPGSSQVYERGFSLYQYNVSLLRKHIKPLVDQYVETQDYIQKHTTEEFEFTTDGVHPNIHGQQYLAKKVVDAINALSKRCEQ